jgi:hypothetical protein
MGSLRDGHSSSSLLSDWTKGLVGGFKTKLEEYDEESEVARARAPSVCSVDGNLGSSRKGEKFRGGDVASQGCCSDLYKSEFCCRSP